MKKYLTILLVFVLCLSPVLFFAGCDKDETFWTTTYQKIENFNKNKSYEFVNLELDLTNTYNQAIIQEINTVNSEYSSLKTQYNQDLIYSLKIFNKYKNSLQVKPFYMTDKNTKDVRKKFEDFNNQFDLFVEECNAFNLAKETFNIQVTENLQEDFCLQKLKDYKRSYHKFILSAIDTSQSLLNLYKSCYLNYDMPTETTIEENAPALLNYEYTLKFTKAYVNITLSEFGGLYNSQLKTAQDIKGYVLELVGNIEKQNCNEIVANYKSCFEDLNTFNTEFNNFFVCLDKLDIEKVEQINNDDYLAENPDLVPYYNAYNNIKNNVFPHIVAKISAMFN